MNKIRRRMGGILGLALLFTVVGAGAQAAPATGADGTAVFLQKAMEGSMAEIELGELAQKNAASTGINALGSRLARDHRRIGKMLQLICQDRGVVLPASLGGDHRSIIDGLSEKRGTEFDAAYAERMVISHEQLIALFDEAAGGSDADVAEFARRALPVLKEGKRLAEVYREVTSKYRPQEQGITQAVARKD